MNTTQAQQKALDDALVAPADRLEFGKCNMRLKTDIKPKEATFQVVLDALALTLFYHAFLITADVPAIYMQEFWATVSVQDLGHTRDITYLTDVNVDYLHQPWRAFATVINKCLSGKETGMDKIHLLFQIEYKDAKKTNKMSYPRFTKIIIDYFMSNGTHEDTQVYGTILPTKLTNQAMLESKAYQTYYAFASGEKAPKPKYIRKKADSDTSPKKKPVQATKGTRLKSKAKVAKPDKKKQPAKKTKAKGLDVLFEVALTEAEQIKLATKRNEGTGTYYQGSRIIHPITNLKVRKSLGEIVKTGGDNDDECEMIRRRKEETLDDARTMVMDEEDDEVTKELYDDVNVNLGNEDTDMTIADQGASDQQNVSQESGFEQVEEDAHVTLTPVIDTQKTGDPTQSSSVSSDFTSKLLNLDNPSLADNEIASLMDTTAQHATVIPKITSSFTTTVPPPPPFLHPLQQEATPTPAPTTFTTTTSTNPIVTLPEIPNFASVFKFDQRVSALESEMSELRQTNQFAEAVSSISGIVDTYLASKMKEAVDVAVQLQTNKLREEAQAENQEFLNQVDSTMKTIIKDQVKAQVSKIMPKIEKYVTESLGAEVLVRSTNQPQTAYAVAASLSEFELKKILIDKMEANKSINRSDNQKNLYNALVESYNSDKDIITSYGDVVLLMTSNNVYFIASFIPRY
ncbi:hypothetical protein Tco_0942383 [Tanacetum coccineum]